LLINEALKEFIFDCEIRKISPRTLKGYRNNNLRFFNYVEHEFSITELEEFSHLHIKKYFRFNSILLGQALHTNNYKLNNTMIYFIGKHYPFQFMLYNINTNIHLVGVVI